VVVGHRVEVAPDSPRQRIRAERSGQFGTASTGPEGICAEPGGTPGSLERVEPSPVGRHRADHVRRPETQALRQLDGRDHVGDRREAEVVEGYEHVIADTTTAEELPPLLRSEDHVEGIGHRVGDAHDDVGTRSVVDQRDMLVPNALDVVLAEAALEQRRALERFDDRAQRAVPLLQVVARRQRPSRARRRDERNEVRPRALGNDGADQPVERRAGDEVVGEVVRHLGELVEHDVRRICRQPVAGVVDLLHVALRPRRAHDVLGRRHPALEPLETLRAHAGGEDRNATAAEDAGDRDTATGVVARRRPDGPVERRVEASGREPAGQARVGREHLVGSDHREAVPEGDDDRRRDAGQGLREDHMLGNFSELGRGGPVEPMEPVEVAEVRAETVSGQCSSLPFGRHRLGCSELCEQGEAQAELGKTGRAVGPSDVGVDRRRFGRRRSWSRHGRSVDPDEKSLTVCQLLAMLRETHPLPDREWVVGGVHRAVTSRQH
jgi:hypothetical protein